MPLEMTFKRMPHVTNRKMSQSNITQWYEWRATHFLVLHLQFSRPNLIIKILARDKKIIRQTIQQKIVNIIYNGKTIHVRVFLEFFDFATLLWRGNTFKKY